METHGQHQALLSPPGFLTLVKDPRSQTVCSLILPWDLHKRPSTSSLCLSCFLDSSLSLILGLLRCKILLPEGPLLQRIFEPERTSEVLGFHVLSVQLMKGPVRTNDTMPQGSPRLNRLWSGETRT